MKRLGKGKGTKRADEPRIARGELPRDSAANELARSKSPGGIERCGASSRRDREPRRLFVPHERNAVFLIRLQPEVRAGADDTFDRGQLFGDEARNFLER